MTPVTLGENTWAKWGTGETQLCQVVCKEKILFCDLYVQPLALLEMTDQLILLLFHATGSSFEMELR